MEGTQGADTLGSAPHPFLLKSESACSFVVVRLQPETIAPPGQGGAAAPNKKAAQHPQRRSGVVVQAQPPDPLIPNIALAVVATSKAIATLYLLMPQPARPASKGDRTLDYSFTDD